MIRFVATAMALALLPAAAWAQQAADSVTVSATQLRAEVERYLGSVSTSSVVAGKIARWERIAICPVVVGLKPEYLSFISARIRAVAQDLGAPVDASAKCRPNIRIVFTTTPQALLDNVRKNHSGLLGYTRSNREADRVAQVIHPVQGWYRTQTVGDRGLAKRDVRVIGMCTDVFSSECPNVFDNQAIRVGNNIKSRFEDVTIVANPVKLGDPEMGALGDLIAMLALSQPQLGKGCQNSVLDLIVQACPNPPGGFSAMDMSYLRSLYHMRGTAVGTRDPIASWMVKDMTGK
jgi:hypothetical protein